MQMDALAYFENFGPPNSPPITILLTIIIPKQTKATIKKMNTENARSPAGTA